MKNDILLILALLVLAGGAWALLRLTRQPGGEAVITVDGRVAAVLPLNRDDTYVFRTEDGHGNTVVVENGRVCVSAADCPDRICVRQGRIFRVGESIVCLPHKLVVTVRGTGAGLDAVAG